MNRTEHGHDDAALAPDAHIAEEETEASAEVMSLLEQHVPLALLADLASPAGPESPDILRSEGLPDVAWWDGEDEAEAARDDAAGGDVTGEPGVRPDGRAHP